MGEHGQDHKQHYIKIWGILCALLVVSIIGPEMDEMLPASIFIWVLLITAFGIAGVKAWLVIKHFMHLDKEPPIMWYLLITSLVFMVLFFATGIGNASTFQMIPVIMRTVIDRTAPAGLAPAERLRQAERESAAIIGFTSAIAAYGAFFIPKAYGSSIAMTGGAEAALLGFLGFYVTCVAVTWFFYTRKNAPVRC